MKLYINLKIKRATTLKKKKRLGINQTKTGCGPCVEL